MSKSLQSLVSSALNSLAAYHDSIDSIKVQMGRKNEKSVRAALMPCVAKHYDVAIVDGKRGDKFDPDADAYEAAKKALQRLIGDVMGTRKGNGKNEAFVPLSRAQLALAKELATLDAPHRRAIWAKAAEIAKAAKE